MKTIFYLIFFIMSCCLYSMERELPVSTTKESNLIEGICQGFIEKSLKRPAIGATSYEKYVFACLKCDGIPGAEKYDLIRSCSDAAATLDPEATFNFGYYYHYINKPVSLEKAKMFYTLAANQGSARAYYYLGICYEALKKENLALEAYKQASDRGYEPAILWLAVHVSQTDIKKAIELYEKAGALRRTFFKSNPEILEKNDRENALIAALKRGLPVEQEEIDRIPYLYEKAILDPLYALLIILSKQLSDHKIDINQRTLLGVKCVDDNDLYFNAGLLCYQAWELTRKTNYYREALEFYKIAGNHALAEYELALMYLNHEQETHDVSDICSLLWADNRYESLLKGKGLSLSRANEKTVFKDMAMEYFEKAASRGHMLAKQMVSMNLLKIGTSISLDHMLRLKGMNYGIKIDDLPLINDCMNRFIKEHACVQKETLIELCTWLESACGNMSDNGAKKDKAAKKLKKTNDQKISDFKKQCSQWVKEINDTYQKYEKQKKQEEKRKIKLEKEQYKKLLKVEQKLEVVSEAPSIKSVEYKEEAEIVNPLSSQNGSNIEKPVFQHEVVTGKKPKVKTRPTISEQPQSVEAPHRPTVSARPPLIRSMSAVALVRKNSKTDLNDPKYKRLVKRLSYSDVMGQLKLDENDIRRTLEELAQRKLIDYRDEKNTITATKKNDHTVTLVIHTHGDWVANRDIVKQFLAFVYEVDSDFWQTSELLTKSKE